MKKEHPQPMAAGGAVEDGPRQDHATAPARPDPSSSVPIRDKLTWSLADVRALTGLSERFIQQQVAAGKMPPPMKIGRRSLWRSAAVVAWLDSLAQEADKRRAK
jgi:predicted DNA-binding transcriptional regulator AlpA